MTSIKKWVGYDYDTFDDVAAFYDFQRVSDLLNSDLIVYHDQTIDGLLSGVGMDKVNNSKNLKKNLIYNKGMIFYV